MKKNKLLILVIYLVLTVSLISTSTLAFLVDNGVIENIFTVDRITGELTATSEGNEYKITDLDVTRNITINKLTYIDLQKDVPFSNTDQTLINKLGVFVEVTLKNTSKINCRSHVKIEIPSGNEGILYLVCDSGTTDYASILIDVMTSNSLTSSSSTDEIRQAINNYNHDYLKSLYENNICGKDESKNLRIVFFGDYDALSETDKDLKNEIYLTRSFKVILNVRLIQNITEYGGEINYDND